MLPAWGVEYQDASGFRGDPAAAWSRRGVPVANGGNSRSRAPPDAELLSRFARYARYYNFDSMTGSLGSGDEEPLAAWDRVVGTEVVKRHHRRTKRHRKAVAFGNALAGVPGIVVSHVLEDGTHATDTDVLTAAAVTIETKQKYSVYYVLCIVEFCVEVLEALDRRQNRPIYVSECFRVFNTLDRTAVLRRKRWNPLP